MIDPVIANFFGPILSNSVPTIGDIITFTALPGSNNKPATAALNNKDPFKYIGNRIPVDKMTKILKNIIAVPNVNIGYLKTFKLTIGFSIEF